MLLRPFCFESGVTLTPNNKYFRTLFYRCSVIWGRGGPPGPHWTGIGNTVGTWPAQTHNFNRFLSILCAKWVPSWTLFSVLFCPLVPRGRPDTFKKTLRGGHRNVIRKNIDFEILPEGENCVPVYTGASFFTFSLDPHSSHFLAKILC